MFTGMPEAESSFRSILTERIIAILSENGLKRTNDSEQIGRSSNPLSSMFAISSDALDELKATDEWDDRPAIDKILGLVIKSAKRETKPETEVVRILGHLPDTCTIVLMVAISFTPSAETDMADLTKVGRWSVALRDVPNKVTKNWQGDVLDRQELEDALDGVTTCCDQIRKQHLLAPIVSSYRSPLEMMQSAEGLLQGLKEIVPSAVEGPQP